jgi:hypothetical protein
MCVDWVFPSQLLDLASRDLSIAARDASTLMRMGLVQEASTENRVRTMCQLLFRLIDPSEAVRLLDECLTTKEKREVQSVLGQAFRLLIGQATGHYRLNMSENMDRDVLIRLLAVNKEERSWLARRYPGLDTSQHGNGHRFRNEKLDGSPIALTPKMLQSVREIARIEGSLGCTCVQS